LFPAKNVEEKCVVNSQGKKVGEKELTGRGRRGKICENQRRGLQGQVNERIRDLRVPATREPAKQGGGGKPSPVVHRVVVGNEKKVYRPPALSATQRG